jgi:hypothetical protein
MRERLEEECIAQGGKATAAECGQGSTDRWICNWLALRAISW